MRFSLNKSLNFNQSGIAAPFVLLLIIALLAILSSLGLPQDIQNQIDEILNSIGNVPTPTTIAQVPTPTTPANTNPTPTTSSSNPTPTTPTIAPTQPPTTAPTQGQNPTPTSGPPSPPPPELPSDYGVYPDCVAPAVGLETHSWWHENGETSPRHIHIATCLPNARGTDGGGVVVDQDMSTIFRVISFNNPGLFNWVRYAWQGDIVERQDTDVHCQTAPDQFEECTWYFPFTVDISQMNTSGMDELRLSPDIRHEDLGTRQFPTLNYQIHRGGGGNYRNSEEPIARSWYTGTDYVRVQWSNYMDLFNSLSQSIPTVSGNVTINVRHTNEGATCVKSEGFIDPAFHAFHAGRAPEPQPFYNNSGCFEGTEVLDTSQLSNGVHTVYLQTTVKTSDGINSGAMAYLINVQN